MGSQRVSGRFCGWLVGCVALAAAACNQAPPMVADACGGCGEGAVCDAVVERCFCDVGWLGDPATGCTPHEDLCAQAEARVGHSACRHAIDDLETWQVLSIGHTNDAALFRADKYLVPATPDTPVPAVFADTNWYRIHYCLLAGAFEPLYPGISYRDYQDLVIHRATREYYGGTVSEFRTDDGPQYVFTIETPEEDAEALDADEIYSVYQQLRQRFTFAELAYTPDNEFQQAKADAFVDPPFPIVVVPEADAPQYEAYTAGLAYGRVRLFPDATQIDQADGAVPFGWQDILVLDDAPRTLEGVMAGSITESRQDVLTHLNVLAGLRGTPNAHVQNALEVFAPHDGELIRLEVRDSYYSVRTATYEEAEAHWAQQRPLAEVEAPPDLGFDLLLALDDIDTASATARNQAVSRFGSKATGVATLRAIDRTLPAGDTVRDHVVDGFGIPMRAYLDFMAANTWSVPLGSDGVTVTLSYAETIDRWLADDDFRSDADLRATRLAALRDEMVEHGVVDPELLDRVRGQIVSVFGDEAVMARFRSSSNAEDSLRFNGAGLYTSVSGCGPDTAEATLSVCQTTRPPKPIDVAIKTVWASLWSYGAFEEREYYQIDHQQVAMGILVNPRFAGERANGVAFTGNPSDIEDTRYTINVQKGEVPVVSSSAGVVAELDRLTIEDGEVTVIDREIASTLSAEGEVVLDDDQLRALGALLAAIAEVYPIDGTPPEGARVMLDLELKITAEEALVLKQVRPFLAKPYVPGGDVCG